jgi:type IV secretory pathway VirB4 component
MNPTQNNSGAQGPAPANYTGGDYTMGSVNAPGGPAVIPPQQAPVNPNSTQNALQISEIRDGVVIMSDGSFRAVVMCHSINFDLMSPQEREAVEFSYQGFLNSLYFPVQIFIRSQKVDMRPYLEKIDRIRKEQDNMLLGLLMEDYIAFLADIAQQTNIMDKKFYLVVKFPDTEQDVRKALKQSASFFTGMAELLSPSKQAHVVIDESTLEKAKTELRNRIQAVMQGLAQCGIQSLPLDTEELIELYYDAYNPDTATRQQIKNFKDLTAPIVTKGEGSASQPQLDREAS